MRHCKKRENTDDNLYAIDFKQRVIWCLPILVAKNSKIFTEILLEGRTIIY